MSEALEKIEALLPQLDAVGRAQLKLKLGALSQMDPVVTVKRGKVDPAGNDEGIVLASFERVCNAYHLDRCTPYYVRRYKGYNEFKKKVPLLVKIARDGDPRSRIVQAAILDLGWSLLYKQLTNMHPLVTAQSMIAHAHLIVPCFNAAFPGYIENGRLKFVIRPE